MTNVNSRLTRLILALLALALVASACGGDDNGNGDTGGEDLSGEISISGSSTVEPISAAVAAKFNDQQGGVDIAVDGPGTGDGFELFCKGETDISDASRPIDPEDEIPACEKAGVEFIELKVAIDGISVITSPENEAVTCLSFQDLYALLGPESAGFNNWSDANQLGSDVGGSGDYPDADLSITAPGPESGTYDSFAELVLEDIAVEERKQSEDGPFVRNDYQSSADDNVIIEGISGSPTSLGWVGYAFYAQNEGTVKAIGVEDEEGAGCVEPTDETIAGGDYPIARELFIYVNSAKVEENPALEAFVDFYLSEEGLASVSEVGYVDLTEDEVAATQETWESKTTGSTAG